MPLSQHNDKSKFEDGRIWNPPLRNNGNFIDSAFFPPKEKWAPKKKRPPQTVFALGKYWARPLRHGTRHVRTHSMGYQKPFSKRFLRSFFLKKATALIALCAPQAPLDRLFRFLILNRRFRFIFAADTTVRTHGGAANNGVGAEFAADAVDSAIDLSGALFFFVGKKA